MTTNFGFRGSRGWSRGVYPLALCFAFGCGSRSITSDRGDGSGAFEPWGSDDGIQGSGGGSGEGSSAGVISPGMPGSEPGSSGMLPAGSGAPGTAAGTPGGATSPAGTVTGVALPGTSGGGTAMAPSTMTGSVAGSPVNVAGAAGGVVTLPGVIIGGGGATTGPIVRPPIMGGPIGVAGAPATGGAPAEIGECTTIYEYDNGSGCEEQRQCGNGYYYTSCYDNGDAWWCDCSAPSTYQSVQLSGVSEGSTCEYAANFCLAGGVDPSLPQECAPTYQEQYSGSCNLQWDCTRSVQQDGISAVSHQPRSVSCYQNPTDWQCDCSWDSRYARVLFSADQASETACVDAIDLCETFPYAESPVECSRTYQSSSAGWCDASLECRQGGTVDVAEVELITNANINCQPIDDTTWQCQCSTNLDATTFEIDGDDAWAVCTTASEQCTEFVTTL